MSAILEKRIALLEQRWNEFERERGIFPIATGNGLKGDDRTVYLAREIVARKMSVPVSDIMGDCRKEKIVRARWLVIYLVSEFTDLSLSAIADYMKLDHGAVFYALKKMKTWSELPDRHGQQLRAQMEELKVQFETITTAPQLPGLNQSTQGTK